MDRKSNRLWTYLSKLFIVLMLFPGGGILKAFGSGNTITYDHMKRDPKVKAGAEPPVAPYGTGAAIDPEDARGISLRGGNDQNADAKDQEILSNTRAAALYDPNYKKCGQDCIYRHAQESLTLQLEFVLKKRDKIEKWKSGQEYYSNEDKKDLMGEFCRPAEPDFDCFERYTDFSSYWMMKARTSLALMERNVEKLKSTNSAMAAGMGDFGSISPETADYMKKNPLPKIPQSMYLLNTREMQFFGKTALNNGIDSFNSDSLKKVKDDDTWEENVWKDFMPEKEDFVNTQKTNDPNVERVMLDEKGNVLPGEYDDKAYKIALEKWKDKSIRKRILGPISKDRSQILQALEDAQKSGNKRDKFDPKLKPGDKKSIDRELLEEARGGYIQEVEGHSSKKGATNPTKGKKGDPKIIIVHPKEGYSGNEQVKLRDEEGEKTLRSAAYEAGSFRPISKEQQDEEKKQKNINAVSGQQDDSIQQQIDILIPN